MKCGEGSTYSTLEKLTQVAARAPVRVVLQTSLAQAAGGVASGQKLPLACGAICAPQSHVGSHLRVAAAR